MKFKIIIEVEGGPDLQKDLERGHVESGMQSDVFSEGGEMITSFTFEKIEE